MILSIPRYSLCLIFQQENQNNRSLPAIRKINWQDSESVCNVNQLFKWAQLPQEENERIKNSRDLRKFCVIDRNGQYGYCRQSQE